MFGLSWEFFSSFASRAHLAVQWLMLWLMPADGIRGASMRILRHIMNETPPPRKKMKRMKITAAKNLTTSSASPKSIVVDEDSIQELSDETLECEDEMSESSEATASQSLEASD